MKTILWIILAHYLLDYPLQGDFLAKTKGSSWYSLLSHSIIYGLGMALVFELLGVFAIWKAFVLVGTHLAIDSCKVRGEDQSKVLTSYLYIDQILHLAINLILYTC